MEICVCSSQHYFIYWIIIIDYEIVCFSIIIWSQHICNCQIQLSWSICIPILIICLEQESKIIPFARSKKWKLWCGFTTSIERINYEVIRKVCIQLPSINCWQHFLKRVDFKSECTCISTQRNTAGDFI